MTTKHTPTPYQSAERLERETEDAAAEKYSSPDCAPTPFSVAVKTIGRRTDVLILDADGNDTVNCLGETLSDAKEIAAHIVKCVNTHDELVAALDMLLHETGGVRNSIAWDSPARGEWLDRIDAARDKARAALAKVQL